MEDEREKRDFEWCTCFFIVLVPHHITVETSRNFTKEFIEERDVEKNQV